MTTTAVKVEPTPALTLDPKWVDSVYDRLGALEVALDPDPLIYGPKRLNGKVAKARNMLRDLESLFLQASHDHHRFSRALRVASAELTLSKNYLFTNDPETRAGRNVADREAIAAMKLAGPVKAVHLLEIGTEDLKSVLTVIKAKRADLKDVQGRLRDQIKLCQEEIGLAGGRWGSQLPDAKEVDLSKAPVHVPDELDAILAAVDGELHLSAFGGSKEGVAEEPEVEVAAAPEPEPEPVSPEPEPKPFMVLVPKPEPVATAPEPVAVPDPLPIVEPIVKSNADLTLDDIFADVTDGVLDARLAATASISEVTQFLAGVDLSTPAAKSPPGASDMDADLESLLSNFD